MDPATGDLLVVDGTANAIKRYNPDGTEAEFTALGSNTIDGEGSGGGPGTTGVHPCESPTPPGECDETPENGLDFGSGGAGGNGNPRGMQVAVAPPGSAAGTAGNIYVTQRGAHLVDVFAASGEYLGQLTEFFKEPAGEEEPEALNLTVGVAVDADGAVYVSSFDGSAAGEVHKYVPASNAPFAAPNTKNFARPSFGHLAAGAVANAGFLFSASFGGQPAKIDSETGAEECVVTADSSVALAANPADGHLLNATPSKVTDYEASCAAEPTPRPSFEPGSGINGIAVDGDEGLVYVSREGLATIEVWEFVKVPKAETLPPGELGPTSARLNGEVNPNGLPLTACFFEWGEDASYGNIAPCEEPDAGEVGEGSSAVAVHAEIGGLRGGSTYHYRLVVENENTTAEAVKGGRRRPADHRPAGARRRSLRSHRDHRQDRRPDRPGRRSDRIPGPVPERSRLPGKPRRRTLRRRRGDPGAHPAGDGERHRRPGSGLKTGQGSGGRRRALRRRPADLRRRDPGGDDDRGRLRGQAGTLPARDRDRDRRRA